MELKLLEFGWALWIFLALLYVKRRSLSIIWCCDRSFEGERIGRVLCKIRGCFLEKPFMRHTFGTVNAINQSSILKEKRNDY